jgi:SOS-response transcriptional repressor LexA
MMFTDADIEAIGKFIRRRRNEKGLSAKRLAQLVGISDAHVIYIEKAQRRATFDKIMNILLALGVRLEDMLIEIGRTENVEPAKLENHGKVPVVSWVTAGSWKDISDAFEPGDADEWIDSDVKGKNVFALRVTGDSMEPEFKDGEIITVNPHLETLPNDYIVVKDREEQATFKQLKKYGSRLVLHPLNPNYQDQEVKRGEFKIIGKVVKKEKRY